MPGASRRTRHASPLPFLCVLCAVFAAGTAAAQEVISDDAIGFSCVYPEGWRRMPPAQLDAIRDAAAAAISRTAQPIPNYIHGLVYFERDDFGSETLVAYSLIQLEGSVYAGTTYDDIEAGLRTAAMQVVFDEIADATNGELTAGEFSLDRERGRLELAFSSDIPGWGPSLGRSIQMLGRDNQVTFHFYTPEDRMAARTPAFRAIADSFAWREGRAYVEADLAAPRDSAARRGGGWPNPLPSLAVIAGGLVGLGLVVALICRVKID